MLRQLFILAVIYLGIVVHCSLVPIELAGLGRPFVPALVLVLIARYGDATTSILWSGVLGLMLDGLSTERLGLQLGLAALLGLGLQLTPSIWKSDRLAALVAATMLTCVAWRALSPMTQAVLAGRTVDPRLVLTSALQDAAWTALLAGALLPARRLFGERAAATIIVANPRQRWGPALR